MDLDNIQQNLNTRVVFKEPRGMVRWLQLLFAIIAFSTVVDFYTTVGIDIKCPTSTPANTTTTPSPNPTPAPVNQTALEKHPRLNITYPFDFSKQIVENGCPGANYTYTHQSSLESSPQFFVMIGTLSLIYASGTLVIYLCFSNTYSSIPALPVADLIITGLLCVLWLLAASTFSSGTTILKSTVNYDNLKQAICPGAFESLPGASCTPSLTEVPSWKSLNVALVSGFMSSFLWGSGMWFVFKETDIRVVNLNW